MPNRAEALAQALEEMLEGDAEAIAEAAAIGIPFPDELLITYNNARAALEAWRAQPAVQIRMFDSQWVNVVNSPSVLFAGNAQDAVAIAVKLTEQAMARNYSENEWPSAPGQPPGEAA